MVFHLYTLLSTLSTELSTYYQILCFHFLYCRTIYIYLYFREFLMSHFTVRQSFGHVDSLAPILS